MSKNNADARATLMQRVVHLEEWKGIAHDQLQDLVNANQELRKQLHDHASRLSIHGRSIAHLDNEQLDHHNMTLGQRLYWLIRGRR